MFNFLMQPVVDFVPWVTRTQKSIQALGDLKGAGMALLPRFCFVLRKKCYISCMPEHLYIGLYVRSFAEHCADALHSMNIGS
jgi:hypothetical protein